VFDHYFGIYHWRERGRRIALGVAVAALGAVGGSVVATDRAFVVGLTAVVAGLWYAQSPLKQLLVPAPWHVERWKYAPLSHGIDWTETDDWLDLGCGTGRSLVGVGADAPDSTTVVGLDVFDSRVILGNGARLARRNAETAGLSVETVRGDAARTPIASDSRDVVTACRLLHDLPRSAAEDAVDEAERVLTDDGTFGVLELGATHEETDDPLEYWTTLLEAARFEVTASGSVERRGSTYYYLLAEPIRT
jgi:ubiquinone/menaquinone biosynthesis C-methylase UbiE